ncbi:hypothetical protein RHSIM_Rhsim02G0042300 [Rhododendron simsii]|uniref:Translation initiation factor eIF2B subunit beta n=1 Tax=Rhododendron simsii TaxID=118357 RepID=A0A834HHQ8_RHOSS|nr:hypothetical protein RHSIM_Rhsim02G0042300 [Rhododendron simsii]
MPDIDSLVNEFVSKLENRKIEGSHASARSTAELLRSLISQQRLPFTNQAEALIEAVKVVGERLTAANPVELAVGNIVKRVLHIIREEDLSAVTSDVGGLYLSAETDDEDIAESDYDHVASAAAIACRRILHRPSLHTLLENMGADRNLSTRKLKHNIIEAVNELIGEIDACHEQIAEKAVEYIHHNQVILTLGRSRTVLELLNAAKDKKRSFCVFIAEGAPRYQGHVLAKELAKRGVQSTVITDSAVFAMISRVNMVIVGVHAVMANGGIIAPVGLRMLALAARTHAIPFVVVAGMHKLCPSYPHNPEVLLNDMRCPSELIEFGEFSDCMDNGIGSGSPLVHVVNPAFDYVPPELVSLFITDIGGHGPPYMNRLITDYYSADDLVHQQKPSLG